MTLFLIVLSSLLIGTVVSLSLILRRKSIEVSESNETIKMIRESKERRKQQLFDTTNKLYDAETKLASAENAVIRETETKSRMVSDFENAKAVIARTNEDLHQQLSEANMKLASLTKKMTHAYVVHQVVRVSGYPSIMCIAEVLYAENIGDAWRLFRKRRDQRLADMKKEVEQYGNIQVHRVWKGITAEPNQNP